LEYDYEVAGTIVMGEYANKVIECIIQRQSIREFSDEPIERTELETILECAVNAPSGHNRQTWKFTVVTNPIHIENIRNTIINVLERTKTDSLYGFENPSAVIIVTNKKINYNAMADGACAMENMFLAAWSLGIGSCWINALRTIQDEKEIRDMFSGFGIPDSHMVVGMVSLGKMYFSNRGGKMKPRRRKDVINWVD
jgi:nitroreductase